MESTDLANRCTCDSSNSATTVDSEDIRAIVHEVLNSLVNQITEYEHSHVHQQKTKSYKDSEETPIVLRDSVTNSDLHSVSPTSEDSGIGYSLSHGEETKTEDLEHADHSDHRHDHLNDSSTTQASDSSASVENDKRPPYHGSRSDPSLFSAFSSSVKYWLGQGSCDKAGECCHYFVLACYMLSILIIIMYMYTSENENPWLVINHYYIVKALQIQGMDDLPPAIWTQLLVNFRAAPFNCSLKTCWPLSHKSLMIIHV